MTMEARFTVQFEACSIMYNGYHSWELGACPQEKFHIVEALRILLVATHTYKKYKK